MIGNFRQQQVSIRGYKASITRDFSKGMSDTRQPDKMDLTTQQRVINMYSDEGNLVLRPGYSKLSSISDIVDIYMHEKQAENELFVAQINSTNRDILKVDRTAGTTANEFSITGEGDLDFTSLRGILYTVNGVEDIVIWDGSTKTTLALDTNKPKLVTNDDSRLWACDNDTTEEILYFSGKANTGKVTNFTVTGTALDRAGIATSKITKYSALVGSGKYVVAFGNNRIEGHRIPSEIITPDKFDQSVGTLKWELDNIGVDNRGAVLVVEGVIYFKPNDDYIYRLNPSSGDLKRIGRLEETMNDIDWSNCQMTYYKDKNILVLNGSRDSGNDATVAYNVETGSFSEFTNVFVNRFAFDSDGVYWADSNRFVQQFTPTVFTDNGLAIDWSVLTQADYAGNIEYYKKLFELFVHVRFFENTTFEVETIIDRRVYGSEEGERFSFSLSTAEELFEDDPNAGDHGIFGGALTKFAEGVGTETILNSQKINRLFQRLEVQLQGSSKDNFEIKGIGTKYFPTNKKVRTLTYN